MESLIERYIHRFRELGRKAGVGYAEAFIGRSGKKYAHDLLP